MFQTFQEMGAFHRSDIRTHSAVHSDYTGSGYTRGHLVPVGDMSLILQQCGETFII